MPMRVLIALVVSSAHTVQLVGRALQMY